MTGTPADTQFIIKEFLMLRGKEKYIILSHGMFSYGTVQLTG